MELSITKWILQSIPESIALACLAIALLGQKIIFKKAVFIGLILATIIFFIRLLPITFGVHTVIVIVSLAVLLSLNYKVSLSRGLLIALIVLIILAAFETLFLFIFVNVLELNFEHLYFNDYLWIMLGWPQAIVIFLLAFIINERKDAK